MTLHPTTYSTPIGGRQAPYEPLGPPPRSTVILLGGRPLTLRTEQTLPFLLAIKITPVKVSTELSQQPAILPPLGPVTQFTDLLLRLDNYKHLNTIRFVLDSALIEGVLPVLIYMRRLRSHDKCDTCPKYRRGRILLERFLLENDLAVYLFDAGRDEYRIAERDISQFRPGYFDTLHVGSHREAPEVQLSSPLPQPLCCHSCSSTFLARSSAERIP
ncbi:hypothetical protein COOONC_00716 [Cooperia oncophora]